MRALVIFFHLLIVFIFYGSAFYFCGEDTKLDKLWDQYPGNGKCCGLSADHWKLISWYFQRVGSYLNVTEIYREHKWQGLYMSHFLKELPQYITMEYYTNRVCYEEADELAEVDDPLNNTYWWHAEFSKNGNSTYWVEEDKLNVRPQILKKNWKREDEPHSGNVVLADKIEVIDHYLNGLTRLPFKAKRAYYVIIIYKEIGANWDKYASSILSKLWKIHGILNAIVIGSCKENNVS